MRIFGAALVILLVAGAPASGEESRSGFHGDGFGLELSGAMALSSASGGYVGGRRFPQWELALRLRIGEYFSIGVVAETVSKTNEGEEYEEKRQQIGFDLQWRFRLTRVIRPWVGVGMSWGSFERVGTDEFYRFSFHLSEIPRFSLGCDFVVFPNLAIGPSFRVGRATQPDDGSHETEFTTVVVGLRVTVAVL